MSRGRRASRSRAFGGSGLWRSGCQGGFPIKRIYPLEKQRKVWGGKKKKGGGKLERIEMRDMKREGRRERKRERGREKNL